MSDQDDNVLPPNTLAPLEPAEVPNVMEGVENEQAPAPMQDNFQRDEGPAAPGEGFSMPSSDAPALDVPPPVEEVGTLPEGTGHAPVLEEPAVPEEPVMVEKPQTDEEWKAEHKARLANIRTSEVGFHEYQFIAQFLTSQMEGLKMEIARAKSDMERKLIMRKLRNMAIEASALEEVMFRELAPKVWIECPKFDFLVEL